MHHNIWQAHLPCKRSFTFAGNTPDECRRICKHPGKARRECEQKVRFIEENFIIKNAGISKPLGGGAWEPVSIRRIRDFPKKKKQIPRKGSVKLAIMKLRLKRRRERQRGHCKEATTSQRCSDRSKKAKMNEKMIENAKAIDKDVFTVNRERHDKGVVHEVHPKCTN